MGMPPLGRSDPYITLKLPGGSPGIILGECNAIVRRYPRETWKWAWQWVFPAMHFHRDPRRGLSRRLHLHESVLQRAFKEAVRDSGIPKPAGSGFWQGPSRPRTGEVIATGHPASRPGAGGSPLAGANPGGIRYVWQDVQRDLAVYPGWPLEDGCRQAG
jgi:hypothetical protein